MKTLPAPETKVRNRTIVIEWTLGTTADGEQEIVALLCTHNGPAEYHGRPHKCFTASLTRVFQKTSDGFTRERFAPYSGVGIMREDVERFSSKRLADFAEKARERVLELHADGNEKVTAMFTPTGGEL